MIDKSTRKQLAERKEREYVQYQRANNLFFDESTDGQLIRFREKLRIKKDRYSALEYEMRSEVEAMQENQCNTFK